MERRYRTFKDFYPFYLSEHANRNSRRLHFREESSRDIQVSTLQFCRGLGNVERHPHWQDAVLASAWF